MCRWTSHVSHQNGNTPLHLAANKSHMDVCTILLTRGADARIKSNDGKTAADLIPAVDSDTGRELYEYLKKIEEERADVEMTFKRAHVENIDSDSDDEDDDIEKDEEEVRRRDKNDNDGDEEEDGGGGGGV
jgi:Ankyrin repeats (many copies)